MRKYLVLVALIGYIQSSKSEETRLLDLEPTDAQNVIDSQDQSLKYAPKIDTNVPAVRFLGNEPHNVLEDIYLARQYHGQDGLGGYLYGYSVPDIAKNEQKKPSGDLKGAYNYINGDGQEIKVEYWDNGDGFHQIDNVPQIAPKQVDDSPEVKAAKDAFLKRWQEEAERNTHPIQNPYNNEGQQQQFNQYKQPAYNQGNQYAASEQSASYQKPQGQQSPQADYSSQPSANRDVYAKQASKSNPEEEEVTGPPKGFFYAYDYPAGIITQDKGRALNVEKRESNLKAVYEENKSRFERQLQQGGSQSGYLFVKPQ